MGEFDIFSYLRFYQKQLCDLYNDAHVCDHAMAALTKDVRLCGLWNKVLKRDKEYRLIRCPECLNAKEVKNENN